jgi:hypothetical protein
MGYALCAKVNPSGTAGSTTVQYSGIVGGAAFAGSAAESQTGFQVSDAGTFSNLTLFLNATGTGRTCRFRTAITLGSSSNGNQVVTPTDTTAGVYTDAAHTDSVSANNFVNYSFIQTTGAATVSWIATLFKASSGHVCYYACESQAGMSTSTASATGYLWVCGVPSTTSPSTESIHQQGVRTGTTGSPSTWKYLQVQISANRATTTTIRSRKNTANGNQVVSITGGAAAGIFIDTSNTDSISNNTPDLINYSYSTLTGSDTLTIISIGSAIASGIANTNDLFSSATASIYTRTAAGQTNYLPITGNWGVPPATEDNTTAIRHQFPAILSHMRIFQSATNTVSGGSMTCQLRLNLTTNGAQSFTIGAGAAAGTYEDSSNTDTIAAGTDVAMSISGGTSGSAVFRSGGIVEQDNSPIPIFANAGSVIFI